MNNTILFTGGGSAGHVTPNLALIQKFQECGWNVLYVGSKQGIEKTIIERINIPYHAIASGKLRRYFSWRTFVDPFLVCYGILQAFLLCQRIKPKVVFSKGGFVSFPVVVGAWINRIPIVIHESDLTPGLANRLCFPFAQKICVTFPEGKKYFKSEKAVVTGTPIRDSLLQGDPNKGKALCNFSNDKPIILVIGGGQGALFINNTIHSILPVLLRKYQVVHLCGKGKVDLTFNNTQGYKQFAYLDEELADIMACSDLVISRAGANSLYELIALKKPHIVIPLSLRASRGDQIHNAKYFAEKGLTYILFEEDMNGCRLLELINKVYAEKLAVLGKLNEYRLPDSKQMIYATVQELVGDGQSPKDNKP